MRIPILHVLLATAFMLIESDRSMQVHWYEAPVACQRHSPCDGNCDVSMCAGADYVWPWIGRVTSRSRWGPMGIRHACQAGPLIGADLLALHGLAPLRTTNLESACYPLEGHRIRIRRGYTVASGKTLRVLLD
jgi:hypothetical protein